MNTPDRTSRRRMSFALIGLLAVPYLMTLGVGFHYDDDHSVVRNPHIYELANLGRFFVDPTCFDVHPDIAMYRPLLLVTYAFNVAWGGGMTGWVFHLTNVVIHAVTAVFVALLLHELVTRGRSRHALSSLVPWVGGAIFALLPVHSEPITYVCARSDLLSSLFVTLSVWAYLRGRRECSRVFLVLSLVAFVAALLSKASGIIVPALIVLVELLVPRAGERVSPARRLLVRIPTFVAFALPAMGYLWLRRTLLGSTGVSLSASRWTEASDVLTGGGRGVLANLLTQTQCLVTYGKLILFPGSLSVEHDIPVVTSVSDPRFLGALAIVALTSVLIVVWSRRRPIRLFYFLWILVGLAPTSSLIPLNVIFAERRLYIAGVGTAGLLAELLLSGIASILALRGRQRAFRKVALAATALLLVAYCARDLARIRDWKDPKTLWEAAVAVAPNNDRAHRSLGNAYAALGRFEEAAESYRESLRLHPGYEVSQINLGEALKKVGERTGRPETFREAETHFTTVLESWPRSQLVYHKLGATKVARYRVLGDVEALPEAEEIYGRLLELYPSDEGAKKALERTRQELRTLSARPPR